MTRSGGCCVSITRICTGEVWVRSTVAVGDEERVLHVARRMVGGNVERREVVVVVLDLRALGDAEAQADEDVDDLLHRLRERMQRDRGCGRRPGSGDVDRARAATCWARAAARSAVSALVDAPLDLVLDLVEQGTDGRALLRRHVAQPAHDVGELALAAEEADAQLLDLGLVDALASAARASSRICSRVSFIDGRSPAQRSRTRIRATRQLRRRRLRTAMPVKLVDGCRRDSRSGGEVRLGDFGKLLEAGRVAHREIGEHLAVHPDAALLAGRASAGCSSARPGARRH